MQKRKNKYIMIYKWNYEPLTPKDTEKKDELAKQMNLHPALCQLLIQRGITTVDEADKFFHPSFENLHDPFLLPDMDKAVDRIEKALGQKERIFPIGMTKGMVYRNRGLIMLSRPE